MSDLPRVLVVDDERQILRALKVILREAGYDVIEAATVEEALDRAAVRPPDAAIVDLMLPDGSGYRVPIRPGWCTARTTLLIDELDSPGAGADGTRPTRSTRA